MKLQQRPSTIKCEQISWFITPNFGVIITANVSSREQVFLPQAFHITETSIEKMKKSRRDSTGKFVTEIENLNLVKTVGKVVALDPNQIISVLLCISYFCAQCSSCHFESYFEYAYRNSVFFLLSVIPTLKNLSKNR